MKTRSCGPASIFGLWLCAALAGAATAGPPPPENDACADAITVSLGIGASSHTFGATGEDHSGCGFADAGDVWFRFVPPESGVYRLETCSTPGDTVLSLHDGCPDGPDSRAIGGLCADDGCDAGTGAGSRLRAPLESGREYLIRVAGFAGQPVAFSFRVVQEDVVAFNDECGTPGEWQALGPQRFFLAGASTSPMQPPTSAPESCGTVYNDAWYQWSAPEGGVLTALPRDFARTGFPCRIAAYPAGACAAGTLGVPLCCGGPGEPLRMTVEANTAYLFRVGSADPGRAINGEVLFTLDAAVGACCLPNGCAAKTRQGCGEAGGYYRGDGSLCAQPNAEPLVLTNSNAASIPDASSAGVSRSIVFGSSVVAARVRVGIEISHPYVGDLEVTLTRAGRTVRLFNRSCGAESGLSLWFDDAAPPLSCGSLTDDETRPIDGFAPLLGESAFGLWTVTVRDLAAQDTGQFLSWTLSVLAADPEVCGSVCRADFGGDGEVSVQDVYDYLAAFAAGGSGADFNGVGGITVQDVYDFLAVWIVGCDDP